MPVNPAELEESQDGQPAQIIYPEAPQPIAVSREQIDALSLPTADAARPIIGIWRQVRGDHSADFAEGNYRRAVLVFRTDSTLDVVRWFGPQGEIRIDSRLRYAVIMAGQLRIMPVRKGPRRPRAAYTLPLGGGVNVRVDPPRLKLPATVDFEHRGDMLILAGKTYERVHDR